MYAEILNTVIDNGRVQHAGDGYFVEESLIAEVRFEAKERGLNKEEIDKAVEFALAHTAIE